MAGGEKEVRQAVLLAFIPFHIYLDSRAVCVWTSNSYVGAVTNLLSGLALLV